jgi:hypothetical protein
MRHVVSTAGLSELTRGEGAALLAIFVAIAFVASIVAVTLFVGLFRAAAAGDRALGRQKVRAMQDRERLAAALHEGLSRGDATPAAQNRRIERADSDDTG